MPRKTLTAPPAKQEIEDLYNLPPNAEASSQSASLLKRFRQSFFLDGNRRLSTLERLKRQYQKDGLVLFLGAGVSSDSGIPGWRGLVNVLLKRRGVEVRAPGARDFDEDPSEVLSKYAGMALSAQFDYIADQAGSKEEFVNSLYEGLYGSCGFAELRKLLERVPVTDLDKKRPKAQGLWETILKRMRENATLSAVGDLLIDDSNGPAKCNSQIHAVLTVNADNLLQVYCMAPARGEYVVNTVDRPSFSRHPGKIPIFHLHGYLDSRGESLDREDNVPALVFRESEYFDVIANPTGFANYTAQAFLQQHNILFIGTSLNDVNIRRWLYNSRTPDIPLA